ncbi:MAG: hypothetical protein PUG48_10610 [Clostridia bacterium]|nr:hypothetical protein [Clostridia bacterium]
MWAEKKAVANSGKSGIIKTKQKNYKISSSIEKRNTGKGNPNAILTFGVDLNNKQKRLLKKLPEFDSKVIVPKKSVSMSDLSALTAKTGDEFAMFTKGGNRLIIRGNKVSVNVNIEIAGQLAREGYRWSGHTHPGYDMFCMFHSEGDKAILEQFNHKSSVIYNSKGQYNVFKKE